MKTSVRLLLAFGLVIIASQALRAQGVATLRGHVLDPSGAGISAAQVTLSNPVNGFESSTVTAADGTFQISNLPLQSYTLSVLAAGFDPHRAPVSLRTSIPVDFEAKLNISAGAQQVEVAATDKYLLVDPEQTGTRAQMNASEIEKLALQVGNRGLESVLVTFPGFEQNANGAIHPRGAHNQMTYVIDGMPISDQLTGAFANAVDPSIVQTVELFTGNIPAEYGNKVAAVANVTTKSGYGSGSSFHGGLAASAAQFDTLGVVAQASGERPGFGYSASVNSLETHRYLDAVSLDNFHNGGHSTRGFLRLDFAPAPRDIFRVNLLAGSSPFELANLRSQQINGMDQRQLMRDFSSAFAWVHTLSAASTYELNASYRAASAQLFGSPGDTPVTATQARRLGTVTIANRYNAIRGRHQLRMGFDYQRFAARENFTLALTDPAFNAPDSTGYNEALLPYDLTRGGTHFRFGQRGAGRLYSGYAQDNVRLGRVQLSLGLRYDSYRFLSRGSQLQPRVGLSYDLRETGTVLRISYNRLYQTPVNENLLLSNSPAAAVLTPPSVRDALGGAFVLIRPERQNLYEAGIQQALFAKFSLGVTYYHKDARDQADNNNFFNTGIIFPIALAKIRVNSVESRLVVPPMKGLSGTFSLTHSRAVSTPPFTGGLFIGNDAVAALTQGAFIIDHDQALALHGILTYTGRKGFYGTLSSRYDSGLVVNPSDPAKVAADPDYADLLPYVNLLSSPPRARARWINDLVVGYEAKHEGRSRYDVSLQLSNLANVTALYNFQSIFVGTRVVQPRTAGIRLRLFF